MTRPVVSVIIAAWKAEAFLERAVRSALASRNVSVEVIVVDDASPDGTLAVARCLSEQDARVKCDRLGANGGPSAARNRAITMANGRYVAVLDADDTLAPDRLARLVKHADANGADIVVDNMIEVDESGERIASGPFLTSHAFATDRAIDLATWIAFNEPMKGGDCIGYLKPLVRRESLPENGDAYDTALRNSEDYYLIAALLAKGGKMTYLAEPGYFYTRSPGSTSHRLKLEHTQAWLDAEQRFAKDHGARLSAADNRAIARRRRALRNVHQLVATTEAVKSRRIGGALSVLASDLRGAIYTLGFFCGVAVNKVLRRKPA